MNICGIIAEYNVFHSGHLHQIQETRRLLGDDCAIVCVMSGNFVQRGESAIMEKHARSRCAIRQLGRDGADLVIELPTPYALASAQGFARGAVGLLESTGICTHLSFGSENGDLDELRRVAGVLESGEFSALLREKLALGLPFAAARQSAAEALLGESAGVMAKPNSILAIEYLSALNYLGSSIEPVTVRRLGAAHDTADIAKHVSAGALRAAFRAGYAVEDKYLPEGTAEIIEREMAAGRFPADLKNCERALLAVLRRCSEEDLALADGSHEGLHRRIYGALRSCTSLEEVIAAAKTKRYARSRICRTLMRAYLGIREDMALTPPPYIRPLAFNRRGQELLRDMTDKASLPVITKPAHARRLEGFGRELFLLEERCTDDFALTYPDLKSAVCGGEVTHGVEIIR